MIDVEGLKALSKDESLVFTLEKVGSKRDNWMVPTGDKYIGSMHVFQTDDHVQISCGRGLRDTVTTSSIQSAQKTADNQFSIETVGGFYELTWRKE